MSVRPALAARLGALGALLFAGACGQDAPDRPSAPEPPPAAVAADETAAPAEREGAAVEAPATPPPDYPGVAQLSPSQRRAYEGGYRDCRAGRYAPGEYAEAYRIGCAAAQDAAPPEG